MKAEELDKIFDSGEDITPYLNLSTAIRLKKKKNRYKKCNKKLNIVKLDDDIIKIFPDSKSVNEALRTLINLISINQKNLQIG